MSRYNRRRSTPSGYAPERKPAPPQTEADRLREAAMLASKARNDQHWSIVADFAWSDKNPGDATRRKIAHFTKLIQLVGDADTAWRAYCAHMGYDYATRKPADLGWLPRYHAALEDCRAQLVADLMLAEHHEPAIAVVDSEVFSILEDCAR